MDPQRPPTTEDESVQCETAGDPESRTAGGLLTRFADAPLSHPYWVVLLILATLLPAAALSRRLDIRTSFSELLPESRPSVAELRRVRGRLAGVSTLIVAAEGRDASSLHRFVDELSPKIRELGPRFVSGVDEGSREARNFVEAHGPLYADVEDLRSLRDDVVARYDYEVGKRTGLDLGIVDEPPPPLDVESMRNRLRAKLSREKQKSGDGYYIGEDGRLAAIVVRTPFESGDPRAFELEQRILTLVDQANPKSWDSSLTVSFTGNLVTSAEEHRAVRNDLMRVGTSGLLLILGIVFLYFLRFRTLAAMTLTIATGCLWSFAFAYLTVGYLNTATGFLVSIIAGNGINFGILLMARYLESRLVDRQPGAEAVRTAMRLTAPGTLAVALCSSVAYGSLAATDFRGFRHFGVIAGVGMLLCWIATYTLLPALLVLGERFVPLRVEADSWRTRLRGSYGRPFAYLATKRPRWVVLGAFAAFLVGLGATIHYFATDPLEYDMRRVRNDPSERTSARAMARRVYPLVGRFAREGRAIVVDRIDQVLPLEHVLEERKNLAPPNDKPFDRAVSVFDLLPKDQDEKIALVGEITDRARRAHQRGFIGDDDWNEVERELSGVRPLGIADLPEDLAWPFEEADGTRGRLVYLVPTEGRSLDDVHYLMRWADSFRKVVLPNGDVIRGTGDPVIFADMLLGVRDEAPKTMFLAVVGTLSVVLIAFRGRRAGLLAMASIVVGITWLVAFLSLIHARINFLNFVALPISVGVGADYAVNLMKRYEIEGPERSRRVLVETGGALVLCSLTTLLGYGALTLSMNGAVRSFGLAGAAGEVLALLPALIVLPAALLAFHGSCETRATGRREEAARPATLLRKETACSPP